ncbi:MAG: glycosyltransferase [Longimicrobiales bacterium]
MSRRVLLVQPSMQPPGGGNGVAAWALQALATDHRVTVLSWRPVDVEPINRFFGTSLRPGCFATLAVPRHWRVVPDRLPVPAALLRSGLLMRYTRRVIDGFDVILGFHNEIDYGRRGIQYVHYPAYLRPRPSVDLRWYHRFPPALKTYYAVADRLAGFSLERMKSNLTLANSDWTAARIGQLLGITAQTLYPPVDATSHPLPWDQRRRGFVAIGRISPEKEYERVMRIVGRVRANAPDVTLTIVGTWDDATRGYLDRLRQLARSLDPSGQWLTFSRNLARDEVRQLLASHRYGIHGMREEHFGMAPAEMARNGMLVWVPNGGGQVEIVGNAPELRYDSEDEAVARILHAMHDTAEERRLRDHLAVHTAQFSPDRFMAAMRSIVETFRE